MPHVVFNGWQIEQQITKWNALLRGSIHNASI